MSFLQKHVPAGVPRTFRPQLTSLVDVMTILLVFLIKSFSVEGNLVTPSEDLELPISSASKPPRPNCSIELTQKEVLMDGRSLVTVESLARTDSLLIPEIHDWLLQKQRSCGDSTETELMVQVDREVKFDIVKKVMFSCSKAGFSDFSVLVLEHDG